MNVTNIFKSQVSQTKNSKPHQEKGSEISCALEV